MSEQDEGYDFRQYKLMESVIDRYNVSKTNMKVSDLQRLVTDLDALRSCLEKPTERFNEIFPSQWATLEEVNAMMQYQGKDRIDEIGKELVENAIGEIRSFIRHEIEKENRDRLNF